MNQLSHARLEIVILSFEKSLLRVFVEVLTLEGYRTEVVHTAAQALSACERKSKCVVLMDNYQVSNEAQTFSKTLFSRPVLHARAKLVGLAVMHRENLVDLAAFVALPPTVDGFFEKIEAVSTTV